MSANPSNAVRLTRLLRVPREAVYAAWLDPDIRRRWWAAAPGMSCDTSEIDANPGGAYRLRMLGPGGEGHVTHGTFVELVPPEKLSFTWNWEHDPSFGGDSLVTVELFETEHNGKPATELVLTHTRLGKPYDRSEHTAGWMGCLKSLSAHFNEPVTL